MIPYIRDPDLPLPRPYVVEQSGDGLCVCTEDKDSEIICKRKLFDLNSHRKKPENRRSLKSPYKCIHTGETFFPSSTEDKIKIKV